MLRMVARAVALLVVATTLIGPTPVGAQTPPAVAAEAADDFPIPNGYFFTQAAPGQNGAGYRVANEAGIPFWDEFQRLGGLKVFGYPVSRRFHWKKRVVQRFQFAVLHWRGGGDGAEVRSLKEVGDPPREARLAEPSPRSVGDAERYPWSGWWWPANHQVVGPRLFDSSGPLAKYDRYVETLGRPDPRTLEWEQAELVFSGLQWAGHCNGWAAAALLEPEPTETRVHNDITFSVGDQKGLLTSYHFADSALWAVGGEDQELSPAELHKMLSSWLSGQRKGMIFTFRVNGDEVWSYPAFKYESVVGPHASRPDTWQVRTTVWLIDNDVPANFVGGRPWPDAEGKVFEYSLTGDPRNPTGGEWAPETSGRFGRPFMVWYPDPARRNVDRQLTSPALEYEVIRRIVRGS
jgi:hypothetical protein